MFFEKSKLYKNKFFNSLLILTCLILIFVGKLDLIALRNLSSFLTDFLSPISSLVSKPALELENVINKISTNQDIEENQIKPIVNNIKMKKDKGTYTEEFGMRAFRYVVDTEIKETVSEEYRNKIASSLLAKYE